MHSQGEHHVRLKAAYQGDVAEAKQHQRQPANHWKLQERQAMLIPHSLQKEHTWQHLSSLPSFPAVALCYVGPNKLTPSFSL